MADRVSTVLQYNTVEHTFQSAQTANANGDALICIGMRSLTVQISGSGTFTVNFEGSVDGTNYAAYPGINPATQAVATSATASGIWLFDVSGLCSFRCRTSGMSGASVTAVGRVTDMPPTLIARGPVGQTTMSGSLPVAIASDQSAVAVKPDGALVTLLAETTITTNGTVNSTPVTGLDQYLSATVLLTISDKSIDAGTTLDLYLQYSPDEGTTWDDLAHFTQITSSAMGNGTYVLVLRHGSIGVADRATTDGTLAANSVRDIGWCDRMRVKRVSANFAGSDTITVKIVAFFQ